MRPLSLTVTGLRSHSGTTPVQFPDDWQLAAIIGPTGAGKSSLLEAIVYALFGCGTVPNASQPINLIADNTREMRVVLDFEVAGTKHELVRTYRRSGASPQPVLKSPGETISGVSPVEDAIMRLLRLSPDAFCQTALLPQGRFARLLEAGATEQRSTLDEFFRLGEVTEIAERLATASDQVSWARDLVTTVRGQLPADPGADLYVAQQALDAARHAASTAAELEVEVARLLANAESAEHRAAEQESAANALDSAARSLDQVVTGAVRLIALAADIGLEESTATADLRSAHEAHAAARKRLEVLDARTATAARTALAALNTRVVEAAQALADAVELGGEALATEEDYRTAEADLEEASDLYKRLDQIATLAETAAEDADRRVRTGQALSEAAARTTQARTDASVLATQTSTDLTAAKDAAEVAGGILTEAERLAVAAHEKVAQADEYLASAGEATARALAAAEQLKTVANAYRDGQTGDDTAKKALTDATGAATQAREQSDATLALREAASTAYQQAEEALSLARRAEATSVCAAEVHAGDPCPVCGRELPKDFTPPEAPRELARADKEMRTARKGLDAASEDAARALVRAETAERDRVAAQEAAAAATASLASSAAAYKAVGGDAALQKTETIADAAAKESLRADKAAHSARQEAAAAEATLKTRGEALQPLHDGSARAERAHRAAVTALETTENPAMEAAAAYAVFGGDTTLALAQTEKAAAEGTSTSARGDAAKAKEFADLLNARRENLRVQAGNARTAAEAARERAASTSAAARSAALDVPAPARPGAGDDPSEIMATAEQWTTDREVRLREADTAAAKAETLIEHSQVALATAQQRRVADHDRPLAQLTTAAAGLAMVAGASEPLTGDAAVLSDWAASCAFSTRQLAGGKRHEATATRLEAATTVEAASSKCQAGGTTVEGLTPWRAETDAAVGRSQTAQAQAEKAAARCAELDLAMEATSERARLLQAGKALCRGRGNFVLHVLAARRRQLVLEAAAILGELSGQRLVFDTDATDRFSVIDTTTATTRDPRLLSGGEQFQASLALALGLVEVAARGGSRIECLFLDEGFAALDSRSLDVALDALETAARRGRRIVAVTHIQDVTSRCDQVLEVRPGPGGSKATWREPARI